MNRFGIIFILCINFMLFPSCKKDIAIDKTPPIITIKGSRNLTIDPKTQYKDEGALAFDNIDGDITTRIVITNPVNTFVPKTYLITYNVRDHAGNTATPITRTVTVKPINFLGIYYCKDRAIREGYPPNEWYNHDTITISMNNTIAEIRLTESYQRIGNGPKGEAYYPHHETITIGGHLNSSKDTLYFDGCQYCYSQDSYYGKGIGTKSFFTFNNGIFKGSIYMLGGYYREVYEYTLE
jgi:hypothetical protein